MSHAYIHPVLTTTLKVLDQIVLLGFSFNSNITFAFVKVIMMLLKGPDGVVNSQFQGQIGSILNVGLEFSMPKLAVAVHLNAQSAVEKSPVDSATSQSIFF